jgi:ankyrin repeat protein
MANVAALSQQPILKLDIKEIAELTKNNFYYSEGKWVTVGGFERFIRYIFSCFMDSTTDKCVRVSMEALLGTFTTCGSKEVLSSKIWKEYNKNRNSSICDVLPEKYRWSLGMSFIHAAQNKQGYLNEQFEDAVMKSELMNAKYYFGQGAQITDYMMSRYTEHHAVDIKMVEFLLENGGNPNAKPITLHKRNFFPPLHNAIFSIPHKDLLDLLIKHKVDLKARIFGQSEKINAVHHLLRSYDVWSDQYEGFRKEGVLPFLKTIYQADPTCLTDFGPNEAFPIPHIVPSLEILEWMVKEANIPVDTLDKNGATALHHVAEKNDLSKLVALIGMKANVNAKNAQGQTPLHLAAEKGHLQIVGTLLGFNADFTIKDQNGKTALDLALMPTGNPEIDENKKAVATMLTQFEIDSLKPA